MIKSKLIIFISTMVLITSCAKQEPAPVDIKTALNKNYLAKLALGKKTKSEKENNDQDEYPFLEERNSNSMLVSRSRKSRTNSSNHDHDTDSLNNQDYNHYNNEQENLHDKDGIELDSELGMISEENKSNYSQNLSNRIDNREIIDDTPQNSNQDILKENNLKNNEINPNAVVLKEDETKKDLSKIKKKTPIKLSMPLEGKVINKFGEIVDGAKTLGINIASNLGVPVFSAADGVVVLVAKDTKFGNIVIVKHEEINLQTAYAHLGSVNVYKGQFISEGEEIGTVGKTGEVKKPMLHFAVRKSNKPVDPMIYLR